MGRLCLLIIVACGRGRSDSRLNDDEGVAGGEDHSCLTHSTRYTLQLRASATISSSASRVLLVVVRMNDADGDELIGGESARLVEQAVSDLTREGHAVRLRTKYTR